MEEGQQLPAPPVMEGSVLGSRDEVWGGDGEGGRGWQNLDAPPASQLLVPGCARADGSWGELLEVKEPLELTGRWPGGVPAPGCTQERLWLLLNLLPASSCFIKYKPGHTLSKAGLSFSAICFDIRHGVCVFGGWGRGEVGSSHFKMGFCLLEESKSFSPGSSSVGLVGVWFFLLLMPYPR